jgi:glycerate dehydrogenase
MQEKSALKKIVFLNRAGLPKRFSVRRPVVDHHWTNYPSTSAELAIERSLGVALLIINKVKITRQLSSCLP